KNRYLIPTYEISGRVLVKDEWKGGYGADAFLPGMEIINERNRLANEMGIIRSFPLMLNAVSNVPDLHISYYDVGKVKKTDNYKKNPFAVKVDTIANENFYYGRKSIRYIDANSFLLSTDGFEKSEGTRYSFGEKINLNGSIFSIESSQFFPAMLEKTNFKLIDLNI
ncbi:MAG TPA: hypothetical protein PK833_02790, partial [Vicingus sp.]|nr:hypothetical protein [Vicingus sp.]